MQRPFRSLKKNLEKPQALRSFYIGWMSVAGPEYRFFGRLLIIVFPVLACLIAYAIAANQHVFSSGIYERNNETELQGVLQLNPFSALKTFYGKDIYGNPIVKTIPLVSFGKSGADSILKNISSQHKDDLNNLWVTVKGKLEYNHGVALLELSEKQKSITHISIISKAQKNLMSAEGIQPVDSVILHGQIIDPKCYLGVMKPGEGKPHSDCAIRCIAGGIQPMLVIRNDNNEETFFILRGEKGEPVNSKILKFVGLPVEVHGQLSKAGEWLVLFVNPEHGIEMENGNK